MIENIIDSRQRPYRWMRVHAIVEATWNDNSVADSDQADRPDDDNHVLFEERHLISVADAVKWASEISGPVTLYLYDD
ncbi:hypothetical protein [Brevundimonas sp.]|mgnify:CR=1 FL=1|uniref:hypothetical protein n=1 Tax=Brevundimonas sp. TaxID=1871086 RepID=UPI001ACFA850|nr:hypothetical protein [Brevundimonas sp.]MBN9466843.1 hypothetical protein [Brevundimonas sp.]